MSNEVSAFLSFCKYGHELLILVRIVTRLNLIIYCPLKELYLSIHLGKFYIINCTLKIFIK